jgi:hypothetical protein
VERRAPCRKKQAGDRDIGGNCEPRCRLAGNRQEGREAHGRDEKQGEGIGKQAFHGERSGCIGLDRLPIFDILIHNARNNSYRGS